MKPSYLTPSSSNPWLEMSDVENQFSSAITVQYCARPYRAIGSKVTLKILTNKNIYSTVLLFNKAERVILPGHILYYDDARKWTAEIMTRSLHTNLVVCKPSQFFSPSVVSLPPSLTFIGNHLCSPSCKLSHTCLLSHNCHFFVVYPIFCAWLLFHYFQT